MVAWSRTHVEVGDGKVFSCLDVSKVSRKTDGWRYLCPGAEADTMRWEFLTTIYKEPKHLEMPHLTSFKIRKRWARYLRNRYAGKYGNWVAESDRSLIQVVKANGTGKPQADNPTVGTWDGEKPSQGSEDLSSTSQKTEEKSEGSGNRSSTWSQGSESAPDYGVTRLAAKVRNDQETVVILGLIAAEERRSEMLMDLLNYRLSMFHDHAEEVTSKQAVAMFKLLGKLYKNIYVMFDQAKPVFIKMAGFLDTCISGIVGSLKFAAIGILGYYMDEKSSVILERKLEVEETNAAVSQFRSNTNLDDILIKADEIPVRRVELEARQAKARRREKALAPPRYFF